MPILGGSFAIWGVLFSCCDCTFTYYRKKEDPWNAILSGAATGGILAARAGIKAAGRSALVGGVILAAIEGLNLVIMRVLMPSMEQQQAAQGIEVDRLLPPVDPSRPRSVAPKKPMWESSPAPSPLFTPSSIFSNSSGDSPPSTPAWDTPGFSSEPSYGSGSSDSSSTPAANSWKFW